MKKKLIVPLQLQVAIIKYMINFINKLDEAELFWL